MISRIQRSCVVPVLYELCNINQIQNLIHVHWHVANRCCKIIYNIPELELGILHHDIYIQDWSVRSDQALGDQALGTGCPVLRAFWAISDGGVVRNTILTRSIQSVLLNSTPTSVKIVTTIG